MMTNKKNYNSLDIGKFIAALFVVAIHANPFSGLLKTILIGGFARLAVPFFFIVSSFLFFSRNPDGKALLHFLKRILLLYFFWGIFAIPIFYIYHTPPYGSSITIGQFIVSFFIGSTYPGSWFLMALMQCVVIIWFLSRFFGNKLMIAFSLICFFLSIAPPSYIIYSELISNMKGIWMPNLIYIAMGKVIAEAKVENKIAKTIVNILLIAVVALKIIWEVVASGDLYYHFVDDLLLVPSVFLLLVFLLENEIHFSLPYKTLRKMSTMFYLSHFTFVAIVAFFLHHIIGVDAAFLRYLLVLCCCVGLYFVLDGLRKIKGFGWIKYML